MRFGVDACGTTTPGASANRIPEALLPTGESANRAGCGWVGRPWAL